MLVVDGLCKSYAPGQPVLRNVTFQVAQHEVLVIIGPSGSGKSTLLRCINFLEEYDEGRVIVAGALVGKREVNGKFVRDSERNINRIRGQIGMVFQHFYLFPHRTVLENIMIAPMRVRGLSRPEAKDVATNLLMKIGLSDKAGAYPEQLSGGQQQRVAIVRALAMKPAVMLFDEVTSALDPRLVGEVLDLMKQLAREGLTMIVVTHEMGFAREVADSVLFLEGGLVVEQGPARQILGSPRDERTRNFLQRAV
ncbi:MAG TPA: amino acid ABC transporter ATP-binding protein [Tepidiformaceae bacterium]|nr:amino acid ABC transporter ATP-binding protein [Tepidiformaceae bacterium]